MVNRARELWENLGRNNQVILVVSSLAVLIALIGFVAWASTPEYVPLFSNLSATDANSIKDKLTEANVPYRFQQGGTAIEVPAAQRDELRMKLMSQGIPSSSAGATLDSDDALKGGGSAFETQPMQDLRILHSKESQISRSIMSLEQVASATVHIAPSEDSPFISDKHAATASVLVTMKPGKSLSDENVQAIVQMTQMSYTGLAEKGISVVDSHGNLLYNGTNGGGAAGNSRMKQENLLAAEKRATFQAMIDNSIGPRKAIVVVNSEINDDTEESDSKTVEQGVLVDNSSEIESVKSVSAPAQTPPGTNTNINPVNPLAGNAPSGTTTYQAATQSPNGGGMEHTVSKKTYVPSITNKHVVKAKGRIEKLTVSALVDSKVPAEQVASIKTALEAAIAVNPSDTTSSRLVSVTQVPFDRTAEDTEAKAAAAARSTENITRLVSVAVPLALMMLCLFLMTRALRKPMRFATGPQLALAGANGLSLPAGSDIESALALADHADPITGQTVGDALEVSHGPVALNPDGTPRTYEVIEEAFDSQLESILHLARTKPETVAALIKSWMTDEKS